MTESRRIAFERISGRDWWPVGRRYRLTAPYQPPGAPERPAGWIWNGPTLMPMVGRMSDWMLEASATHDAHYEDQVGYRWEADARFLHDMMAAGAPWHVRNGAWLAVRACGGYWWADRRRTQVVSPREFPWWLVIAGGLALPAVL